MSFQAYLDNIQDPAAAAASFAEDGILELPTVNARAVGPAQVQGLVAGLLKRVPDFRFKDLRVWIDTPDKIKRLREALDTAAAAAAFKKD